MFKKTEPEEQRREPAGAGLDEPYSPTPARRAEPATIGPSIRIRGDLTGEEDLVVQGKVDGTIGVRNNLVTIGKDGHVSATVNARGIVVEGKVEGDLHGDEQVIVRRSGNVEGNITAPRVTLEDGCRFKGSIDMDVETDAGQRATSAPYGGGKISDIKPPVGGADSGTNGGDQQIKLK